MSNPPACRHRRLPAAPWRQPPERGKLPGVELSPDPALFAAFPGLRDRLPRVPFLTGPTPVSRWDLPGLSATELWIKHDERSSTLYGGNKPRKLELVIGAARARGARRLVTTGGLGTNHGLATTVLGRAAGLATTLVLLHQPVTEEVRRKLLLDAAWGAELLYRRSVPGVAFGVASVLARSTLRRERPFLVPTGGSSPVGNAGFVSAGMELGLQVKQGLLPAPASVWVPVGTGGTLAGLVVGLRLAGLASRVVGVLVTDVLAPRPARLARAARATAARLRRLDSDIPPVSAVEEDFELITDQVGPGYGSPTPAAQAAVDAARESGLALETTYTGKCLAALHTRAAKGELGPEPVLFWNTHNAVDAAANAPVPPDPRRLPPALRRAVGLA